LVNLKKYKDLNKIYIWLTKNNKKDIIFLLVLLGATFLLIPRIYETGGESWKSWASAKILFDGEGFQTFSKGPLYLIYLQLFQWFDYPFSIRLEYTITYTFCIISIYLFLRQVLPNIYSLLLTCAWIPFISIIESGATIAGIGFVALYFKNMFDSNRKNKYLPLTLMIATFCHVSFLFFLIGHLLGTMLKRYRENLRIFSIFRLSIKSIDFSTIFNILLCILLFLVIVFPLSRNDLRNHSMTDQSYSPVPSVGGLTMAFFQLGHLKWVGRNVPEEKMKYEDWYFTHNKSFSGATGIIDAHQKNLDTCIRNFVSNLHGVNRLPIFFLTQSQERLTLISLNFLLLLFFIISFIGGLKYYWSQGNYDLVCTIILGTVSILAVLLLTSFNNRYVMLLFPVALFIIAHFDKGFQLIRNDLTNIIDRKNYFIGMILLLIGIFTMEWALPVIIKEKMNNSHSIQFLILNCFFISFGLITIINKTLIIRTLKFIFHKKLSYIFHKGIILASIVFLFCFPIYRTGIKDQLSSVFKLKPVLSGYENGNYSLMKNYDQLLNSVNKKTKILALEHQWLLAFTNIPLENIYQMHSLPPFKNNKENVKKLLNKMDVIWVSNELFDEEYQPKIVQQHLRYTLHLKPFLETAVEKGEWFIKEIPQFGKIYQRQIL